MDFYSTPVERNEGAKISANFLAFRRACLQDPMRAHRTAEAIVRERSRILVADRRPFPLRVGAAGTSPYPAGSRESSDNRAAQR